jgi:hypothetical protein
MTFPLLRLYFRGTNFFIVALDEIKFIALMPVQRTVLDGSVFVPNTPNRIACHTSSSMAALIRLTPFLILSFLYTSFALAAGKIYYGSCAGMTGYHQGYDRPRYAARSNPD